jgi:hypothetical protein
MDKNEKFDKFLSDLETNKIDIYKLAGIENTPENIMQFEKIIKSLVYAYREDYHYTGKQSYRYADFRKWLIWKTEGE